MNTTIPEPSSPTEVAVGKYNGETVVAARMVGHARPWAVRGPNYVVWRDWADLCNSLTDIRVVDVAELADKPEPGPWLRGDELKAVLPTLKADDTVEGDCNGHTATGKLWEVNGILFLFGYVIRYASGKAGPSVDALRIIESAPEPEPGADIPDEVVDAAFERLVADDGDAWGLAPSDKRRLRLALAAADAKRAELEGRA